MRSAAVPAPAPPSAVITSLTLPVVGGELARERGQRGWPVHADVAGRGVAVDHRARDRQRAVGLQYLDHPGLLRPVDVRGGGDLPEPARSAVFAHRGHGVDVRVPVDPGHNAAEAEQERAQFVGQDPAIGARRAPVVHQGLQRMMAEQDRRPALALTRGQLAVQPAELRLSTEPCQPPFGLTVSSTMHRTGHGRTRSRPCPRRCCARCSRAPRACPCCGSAP